MNNNILNKRLNKQLTIFKPNGLTKPICKLNIISFTYRIKKFKGMIYSNGFLINRIILNKKGEIL